MNYLDLRQKYLVFSYDKFEYVWEKGNLKIVFHFSCSELKFQHQILIPAPKTPRKNIDFFVFNLGLSILPSYWKLFCSQTIKLPNFLTDKQLSFWHKLFIKGMGEYFYKNNINFTSDNFLKFEIKNKKLELNENLEFKNKNSGTVLAPVGGGKDSIVTLELLKPEFNVLAFAINPVPLIKNVIEAANVPAIFIQNIFDPQLFELNQQSFLNGHVPISAFYAFCSLLTARLLDIPYIAFSNERSSGEGNTFYLNREINHQYSKTLEFETDLNNYISSPKCFSFLRPLYELQITKLFSQYPQYFSLFSSCNNNFKMQKKINKLWCCECPKCISTALMLAQFISKDKVTKIMGAYPPSLYQNQPIMDELTGKSPVKPFECVLTRKEAIACATGQNLDEILNSWQDNPNMPKKFSKILQNALHLRSN